MLCIYHESTDPYFNVATDEYILKYLEEDCFMLWRNDNAIIVGKFQNTLAEINYDYVKAHHIAIVRRMSGGGAVYHDLGNLNFTFTQSGKSSSLSDFEKYTQPIIEVLQELGVHAEFKGKNDIMVDGLKISGNAEHIYKNKILHHGTLLFSSKMKDVSESLRIHPIKYIHKAVKSIPKRVTNISEHLKTPLTIEEFAQKIMNHVLKTFPGARLYELTEADKKIIRKLRDEKYATDEWNFGRSPKYNFKRAIRTNGGVIEVNLDVEKGGIIQDAKIYGDFFSEKGVEDIENALIGILHDEKIIRETLDCFSLEKYFKNISLDELITAMF